jgi:hypothetical protein
VPLSPHPPGAPAPSGAAVDESQKQILIYVDPTSDFVGVVLSSREAPVSAQTHEMLHALSMVSAHLLARSQARLRAVLCTAHATGLHAVREK